MRETKNLSAMKNKLHKKTPRINEELRIFFQKNSSVFFFLIDFLDLQFSSPLQDTLN
jgi:hypothetical protein